MNHEDTNWQQSVTGVVIREGKVLLARHTYGPGKGRLIVPGGYVEQGETPQDAVRREIWEETGVRAEPEDVIAIRFNRKDWYVAFSASYVEGRAHSDGDENSEVVWMDTEEALEREDVPDLTKKLISCALSGQKGLTQIPFQSSERRAPYSLYGICPDQRNGQ